MMMAREKATAKKRAGFGQVASVYFAGFWRWSTITVLIERPPSKRSIGVQRGQKVSALNIRQHLVCPRTGG